MSDELYKSVMGAVRSNEQPLMLAKWGTDEDNAIRAKGSKIQSPTIAPDSTQCLAQRVASSSIRTRSAAILLIW